MTTLARKFFNSIKEKNKELICRCANELKEKLGDDNVMMERNPNSIMIL